jgi:GAF domain-containing protein
MVVIVIVGLGIALIAAVMLRERLHAVRISDVDVNTCLSNLDRLHALAITGLMDTPRRSDLDALTSEAAQRLQAPMAIMSLLDDRRAFFASAYGLQGELDSRRENPVHHSYCKYVVARGASLTINDALRHRLVKDHPATHNGTRSYLGVPIRAGSGQTIGSFCVVDTIARRWTDDDRKSLENIAHRAMAGVPT